MRLRQHILSAVLLWFLSIRAEGNPWNGKVVLQGFWWNYRNNHYPNDWATYLADLAPRLRSMGIDAVWVPPTVKNQNATGQLATRRSITTILATNSNAAAQRRGSEPRTLFCAWSLCCTPTASMW